MPPLLLTQVAVAAVWLYEGLWCKLLGRMPHQFDVVGAVPFFSPGLAAWVLRALGLVDVTQYVLREALRRWRAGLKPGREPNRLFCYKGEIARCREGVGRSWAVPEEGF